MSGSKYKFFFFLSYLLASTTTSLLFVILAKSPMLVDLSQSAQIDCCSISTSTDDPPLKPSIRLASLIEAVAVDDLIGCDIFHPFLHLRSNTDSQFLESRSLAAYLSAVSSHCPRARLLPTEILRG